MSFYHGCTERPFMTQRIRTRQRQNRLGKEKESLLPPALRLKPDNNAHAENWESGEPRKKKLETRGERTQWRQLSQESCSQCPGVPKVSPFLSLR
jgi:hypothetical protein